MKTNRKKDIYREVTDRIIAAIEDGTGDVQMPWHRAGVAHTRPTNIDTNNPYQGVNIISLWASAEVNGYSNGTWGTYRQWQKRGAQVQKGEKSSLVIFYKELEYNAENADTGELEPHKRLMARASAVFNADQVDGYELPKPEIKEPLEIIEQAERFVANTEADIRFGGGSAFYRPSQDYIQMPDKDSFTGTAPSTATEGFYGVLLHELTHWSGAKRRCDRGLANRFGDDAYAMEELVAELGAAFLSADLGVTSEPRSDHASYIDHWLKVMKADKKAIFTAAAKASQAAGFLTNLQPEDQEVAA